MKKVILGLVLLGVASGAQAQIAAGTKLLSGSIGYSQNESIIENSAFNREAKTKNFNFTPTIGYFIAENLAVGVNLDFISIRQTGRDNIYIPTQYPSYIPYEFVNKVRTINTGIFARYYTFIGEKAAFFGQIGGGYSNFYSSSNSDTGNSSSSRQQGFYGNILPGFAFFPTNKFALELTARGLSYNRVSSNLGPSATNGDDVKSIQNGFDLGFGLQNLRLGASFYLGR